MQPYCNPDRIPVELRAVRGWLLWRYVSMPGEAKPRKVPHYVDGTKRRGAQGSPDDRAGLGTFDQAVASYRRGGFDGIGLALLPEFGLVALDFDNCGAADPWVLSLVLGSYAERSPSGNGVRAFYWGVLPDGKTSRMEVFHANGFVTITGDTLPDCDIFGADVAQLPEHIGAEWARLHNVPPPCDMPRGADVDLDDLRSALASVPADDYATWHAVGQALKPLGDDRGLPLWLWWSATSEKSDEDAALRKWHRDLKGDRTGPAAIFARAQRLGWINPRKGRPTDRSDQGNADWLVNLADGNLRYVVERALWIWWNGKRWTPDESGSLVHAQRLRVATHYEAEALKEKQRAGACNDPTERAQHAKIAASIAAWAVQCRNRGRLDAMTTLAALDPGVSISINTLDRDPMLLGVRNGVVDLRTGLLRPAGRDDLVTKVCAVDYVPTALAPRWRRFIGEITATASPRPALAAYMHAALGYMTTGSTAEHKMIIFVGDGSNGKNVLLDTVQRVMGDYAVTIPPEALMAGKFDNDAERPNPVMASLAGARLAISSESKDGQKLAVALVKRHTGGGYLIARLMRENPFRFEITHKLVLMTNHRPGLDHMDAAMQGRVHLVPFDKRWNRPGMPDPDPSLPDGDKHLMQKLEAEAEGILAWLVAGAVRYGLDGLAPPAEVRASTRDYFDGADSLGQWLALCKRVPAAAGMGAAAAFDCFKSWCFAEDAQQSFKAARIFSKEVQARGVSQTRTEFASFLGILPPNS